MICKYNNILQTATEIRLYIHIKYIVYSKHLYSIKETKINNNINK